MPLREPARGRKMTAMIKRIALSLTLLLFPLTLLLFPLTLGACGADLDAANDDEPTEANGIGTSPSDPEGIMLLAVTGEAPDSCGLWTRGDDAALVCSPADVAVWPSAATCADLIRLADARWPGRAVVRRLDGQLRALEAACF